MVSRFCHELVDDELALELAMLVHSGNEVVSERAAFCLHSSGMSGRKASKALLKTVLYGTEDFQRKNGTFALRGVADLKFSRDLRTLIEREKSKDVVRALRALIRSLEFSDCEGQQ